MDTNSMIEVGKVGAPYGIKGLLKIHSFTEPFDNLLKYQPWFFKIKDKFVPFEAQSIKPFKSSILVGQINGSCTPEEARAYTNQSIYVDRALFHPLPAGEYYWKDLIGLSVFDEEAHFLGKVDSIMETGSNDVLVLDQKPTALIPFIIPQYIKSIDQEKGCIYVWGDGVITN